MIPFLAIFTNCSEQLSFQDFDYECAQDSDCAPGYRCDRHPSGELVRACVLNGVSAWESCQNLIRDDDETDIDCGGSCAPCTLQAHCLVNDDCRSELCDDGLCVPASCSDGKLGPNETDIDCGADCAPCDDGKACYVADDCLSGVCIRTCREPSCTDGVKNGSETQTDCGGVCPACIAPAIERVTIVTTDPIHPNVGTTTDNIRITFDYDAEILETFPPATVQEVSENTVILHPVERWPANIDRRFFIRAKRRVNGAMADLEFYLSIVDSVVFVSANSTAENRDGSRSAPFLSLTNAIAANPATINAFAIAQGNYQIDSIEQSHMLIGGYSDNFTVRNPTNYPTTITTSSTQSQSAHVVTYGHRWALAGLTLIFNRIDILAQGSVSLEDCQLFGGAIRTWSPLSLTRVQWSSDQSNTLLANSADITIRDSFIHATNESTLLLNGQNNAHFTITNSAFLLSSRIIAILKLQDASASFTHVTAVGDIQTSSTSAASAYLVDMEQSNFTSINSLFALQNCGSDCSATAIIIRDGSLEPPTFTNNGFIGFGNLLTTPETIAATVSAFETTEAVEGSGNIQESGPIWPAGLEEVDSLVQLTPPSDQSCEIREGGTTIPGLTVDGLGLPRTRFDMQANQCSPSNANADGFTLGAIEVD